jgi:N-methylhydantoinase A/oxoprolinase/acetone carboxylase beta subunit
MLASEHPETLDVLRRQMDAKGREGLKGQFVVLQRAIQSELGERERRLLQELAAGPRSLRSLVDDARYGPLIVREIESLAARQLVLFSRFTPTDALHVLGSFERWNAEASRLGAALLARRFRLSLEAFCEQVIGEVSNRVTLELVSKVLGDEATLPRWEREPSAAALLARAVGNVPISDIGCNLTLQHPVVAVGAPVKAYLPRTAQQLGTELVIPPYAEVANAVGAVAGGVVQRMRVLIRPMDADLAYRVHLPDGYRDAPTVDHGVALARDVIPARLTELARQAGADQVEVQMERVDRVAPVDIEWGQDVFVETELVFTAVGRPSLAQRTVGEAL